MIDEKTIEHAAQNYNPINDMLGEESRNSFKAGAEWFKKAIWHHEDEIPDADRLILIKNWKCKDGHIIFNIFNTTKDLCLKDFDKGILWEYFCDLADLDFTWCYIDDLLPRKGGQEDD